MNLVLFDMDHTLIPCDSCTLWAEFLAEHQLIEPELVAKRHEFLKAYHNGTLDLVAAYQFEFAILQLFEPNKRLELINEFFHEKIKPLIYQKAIDQVMKHKNSTDNLVMITATVNEIAQPAADFFGIEHLIATYGELDKDGNYTGNVELEPCMGRGKLVHLEAWLQHTGYNPHHYTFYSDSHNDIPLLEQVDLPIVVDPDQRLKEHAQQHNWQVISFID